MTVSSPELQQLPTLFQTSKAPRGRAASRKRSSSCLNEDFQRLQLYRSQDSVCAELLKEQGRAFGHGFDGCILPGLHTQRLRGTPFVAKLFPDTVKADQVHWWKNQGSLTLQVTGGSFHFVEHQGQRFIGGDFMIEEQIGGTSHQVFHLPACNADQLIIHQEQKKGFLTESFHGIIGAHCLFTFT